MSLGASEFYEAGMSLPPAARKDVALRVLESVESDDALDRAIPTETVPARLGAKWAARS